jgi:hypothetical protein
MTDIVDDIAERAALDRGVTERAVGLIAAHLVDEGPKRVVRILRDHVEDLDRLAAIGRAVATEPPRPVGGGAFGRIGARAKGTALVAAVGALLGGRGGRLAGLIGRLGAEGLDIGDTRRLTAAMIAHLRAVAGDAVVDDLIARTTGNAPFVAGLLARVGRDARGD